VRVRLSSESAAVRLDSILARYRKNGRGAGFWVSPFAEPVNFEELLRKRRLHCRKYYPGMYTDLAGTPSVRKPKRLVRFATLEDYSIFKTYPHPYMGRISTPYRRYALAGQKFTSERTPRRCWQILALDGERPVGICTIFKANGEVAGFFDVGVLESERGAGIGTALMAEGCRFAKEKKCNAAVLISSGLGYSVYTRAGFREVEKFGFWYTARP
jgi:GNAT superfamily N-acetyltransferase